MVTYSPQVHEAEPEEQHEGGEDEPAMDELNTNTMRHSSRRFNYSLNTRSAITTDTENRSVLTAVQHLMACWRLVL